MLLVDSYYALDNDKNIVISAQQASDFAKNIASDFNPIHNVDSKRFCVPGDLIFAISLAKYGLFQRMAFSFNELISANAPLNFPDSDYEKNALSLSVLNAKQKSVTDIKAYDKLLNNSSVTAFISAYVCFSGQNFPPLLLPLMEKHQVMVSATRPLVIYKEMSFEIEQTKTTNFEIQHKKSEMQITGKRANVTLYFSILDQQGDTIGHGEKLLILSGLIPYDYEKITQFCHSFEQAKNQFFQNKVAI